MCDGLFLIEDTAKHNGFEPDVAEIHEHLTTCEECSLDDAYADWAEETYDPDARISYWPDDAYLAEYDRLKELDGHA